MDIEDKTYCRHFGQQCPLLPREICTDQCAFETLLDLFSLGMAVYRQDTRKLLFANETARSAAGSHRDDLVNAMEKELGARMSTAFQFPFSGTVSASGRIFGYTAYPLLSDFILVICRDVTQLERDQTMDRARAVYDAYNKLISEIIHEIGNPLAGVMSILQVTLLNMEDYDRDTVSKRIGSALNEVKRLAMILKLLRPFGSNSTAPWEQVNVRDLLEEIMRDEEENPWSGTISLGAIPENWHATLRKDDFELVVKELCENARNAMPSGGTLTIRKGEETAMYTELLFVDTGPGIPEDMMDRVFGPFFSKIPGKKGMGLTISRKRMLNMGGTLYVKPCDTGACLAILIQSEGPSYELFNPIG